MNIVAIFAVLTIGWAAISGNFSLPNLLLGAAIAWAGLFLLRRAVAPGAKTRTWRILALSWQFLVELIMSAIRVAELVLRPDMHDRLRPAFVAVPLTVTHDAQITLLANMVTLTPGTLSVDVSRDRKFLHVHALNCTDREALIRDIKEGFERRVLEVMS